MVSHAKRNNNGSTAGVCVYYFRGWYTNTELTERLCVALISQLEKRLNVWHVRKNEIENSEKLKPVFQTIQLVAAISIAILIRYCFNFCVTSVQFHINLLSKEMKRKKLLTVIIVLVIIHNVKAPMSKYKIHSNDLSSNLIRNDSITHTYSYQY